jgi:hypothetical protein
MPFPGQLHEGINPASDGIGIRIVAVINHGDEGGSDQFGSPLHIVEIRNSRNDFLIAESKENTNRYGSEGRINMVPAESRNPEPDCSASARNIALNSAVVCFTAQRAKIIVHSKAVTDFSLAALQSAQFLIVAIQNDRSLV